MHTPVATQTKAAIPLCVDLDGTLIKTDLVWESIVRLLKRNPLYVFALVFWLIQGRAYLKEQVAARVKMDVASLPYHQEVIDFIRAEKTRGRPVILATASDISLARQVAEHLGCFDEVLGSDGGTNLRAHHKVECLSKLFGRQGFDYAGNSSVDLPVWEQAREAIVVSGSRHLAERARQRATVSRIFSTKQNWPAALVRVARPHQWVKNLILFLPSLSAHKLLETPVFIATAVGFVAFCLCASGVYMLNDLVDVEADRHHSMKKKRPFASGELPLSAGLVLVPILFAAGGTLALQLPARFGVVLAVYALLTTSYSWRLKQIPLVDVFCLAGLYTIRLVAGHEAGLVEYSNWLLVFSMFLFLSLALVKRFIELASVRQQSKTEVKGRGYAAGDLEVVATMGTSSGYLAVLVLALYVNSPKPDLYAHPIFLLLICPLLLYWISRVWLLAHRGMLHDDPIVFALKDPASYLVGALTLLVLWLATG